MSDFPCSDNIVGTIQGFTPTFSLTVRDQTIDMTAMTNVYVTLEQGKTKITKSTLNGGLVVTEHQVDVYLSQQETLGFSIGDVDVQLNATLPGGRRGGSKPFTIKIGKNLERGVLV